jgi:hypothetical protein
MKISLWLICIPLFFACSTGEEKNDIVDVQSAERIADLIESSHTGISFSNIVSENNQLNRLNYEYLYNGGGVAAGDINNDGLADIYFTGNMVADRLYLNQGDFKFSDITESAGIPFENDWHTGVTMVDINQDGLLDIYVCRSGWFKDRAQLKNRLYVNQGNNKFLESAAIYGLDDSGYGVQAIFFDVDKDGDLDAYVGNNPEQKPKVKTYGQYMDAIRTGEFTTDVFYENVDGRYQDKTAEWGFNNFG